MRRSLTPTLCSRLQRLSVILPCLWLVLIPAVAVGGPQTSTGTASSSSDGGANYPTKSTEKKVTASGAQCNPVSGIVVSKNDEAKTFVVHPKSGAADRPYGTNTKTTFWEGKDKVLWANLVAGQNVRVTCTTDGLTETAKDVRIDNAKELKPHL